MFCSKCGNQFEGQFCSKCGTPSSGQYQQPNNQAYQAPPIIINNVNTNNNAGGRSGISVKSKWVAFVLCLLLGVIGIHRFYVGKVGTGIIWMFTGGLFGIGWIIDLIMILCGSFTDSAGCFLKI